MNLRRPSTALAASLLAVVAVLGPGAAPGTASTGATLDRPFSDRVEDPLLDTSRYWIPQASGPTGGPAYGALRGGDIRQFAGGHTEDVVSAIVRTGRMKGVDTTATLGIRTPGRVDYRLRFERSADEETSVELLGPTGEPVECEEPMHGWIMDDYRWTKLSAPTACMGDPEWVRIGASTTAHAPGQRFGYADDARREGRADPDSSPQIGGPRLFPYDP
jgi:hypothetical protein